MLLKNYLWISDMLTIRNLKKILKILVTAVTSPIKWNNTVKVSTKVIHLVADPQRDFGNFHIHKGVVVRSSFLQIKNVF